MRLFIGLEIPEPVRRRFAEEWANANGRPADFRPTPPENWHCTLAFLGEVRDDSVEALTHLIGKAAENPPGGSFLFKNFETFPPKHPRYVIVRAVPQPHDRWVTFIDRMREMISVISPNIDRKPWHPHVSLGRERKGRMFERWVCEFEPFEWRPEKLCLVKSQLTKAGSVYTDICCFPLIPPNETGAKTE